MQSIVCCRHCGYDAAFILNKRVIWPNGKRYLCHKCYNVGIYYPQREGVTEAEAKKEALRLREGQTQKEQDIDVLYEAKRAHEMMLVVRRKSMKGQGND